MRLSSSLSILLALSMFGCDDGGTVVDFPDSGVTDSGALDSGTLDIDAGSDAGTLDIDSGPTPDAGPAEADGGPILPPADAGDPFGDAGTLGTPEWVELDVLVDGTTCTPLVACGGDELGTWDVTGGCVEVPFDDRLMMCPGATVTAMGRARGRVTFADGVAIRVAQSEVEAEIFVPSFCASFAGGCPAIQTLIRMSAPDAACVTEGAGDCRCAIRQISVIDDADAYTIETNQIVSAALGKRWDYCVGATPSMRYRDVTPGTGPREPGIIELGRR